MDELVVVRVAGGPGYVIDVPEELDAEEVAAAIRGSREGEAGSWVRKQDGWLPVVDRAAWVRVDQVVSVHIARSHSEEAQEAVS